MHHFGYNVVSIMGSHKVSWVNSVAQSSLFDADCTVEQPSTNHWTVRIQRGVKRPDLANPWGKVMNEIMTGHVIVRFMCRYCVLSSSYIWTTVMISLLCLNWHTRTGMKFSFYIKVAFRILLFIVWEESMDYMC